MKNLERQLEMMRMESDRKSKVLRQEMARDPLSNALRMMRLQLPRNSNRYSSSEGKLIY